MTIQEIKNTYANNPQVQAIGSALSLEESRVQISGLVGSASALVASAVVQNTEFNHLFVLDSHDEAAYFLNDLENLNPKLKLLFFPSSFKIAYQLNKTESGNVLMRAEALNVLRKEKGQFILVSYPEALSEKVVTKQHLSKNTLEVNVGDSLSIDFITELLIEYEFDRVDFVVEPGQFSVRGGIVDVFSYSNDYPYRIEFFGDEIDSIRTFDIETQLSVQKMEWIAIVPNVQTKLLKESRQSFFDFLPKSMAIWATNFQLVTDVIDQSIELTKKNQIGFNDSHGLQPEDLFITKTEFEEAIQKRKIVEFGVQKNIVASDQFYFNMSPQPNFNKNFELLSKTLEANKDNYYTTVIAASNARQIERLFSIFEDIGKDLLSKPVLLPLKEGFVDKDALFACFTDHQIFERYHRFRLKDGFKDKKQAITLKDLYGLKPGDFVTHVDHGVGKFDGLQKIEVNGKLQEAIRLVYRDNDVLYVSIHSLHRVSKFSGKEGTQPKVNKLGTKAWANLKQKTKTKVKEIAYDLIQLYAKRKAQQGHAFAPDTYLNQELEASFIYEDTPDQEKTTIAVKRDMESESPMDRLVCGDVGFGKTEIAIRAAFKAACDGKQVAVLVPTTILALQHFKTFSNRLKEFPVTVDYLNRFKTSKAQKETLAKLKNGQVDIIVGTHRLTGKDVVFNDLGLLIIDEEQKFGVAVKDKLKTLKANVDTLTLTATPIPRTLQFSMLGARDLSVIATPPPNRHPVITEIHTFNEEVIKESVLREVSRGGQVFFIHNRVANIVEVGLLIEKLCPGVKVITAHGQMEGPKLEAIMLDFIEGDYDVLVATTIIESGLDIPNANTIIINQAQNFGLSDLHQMRGRVGRSNKKAYCYLLAPPMHSLTPEARQRLHAIEQFSELGSGFNVAMRDLDIRGAGNLLGGEQSGFINEIGFEMYQKILDEAVQELRENEFKDLFADSEEHQPKSFVNDCQIDTDVEIMIPDNYVNNTPERLNLYKELGDLENEQQLKEFEAHLIDRFGPIPKQTLELFDTLRLQWVGKSLGFEKITLKNNVLLCYFIANGNSAYYQSPLFQQVIKAVQQLPHKAEMKQRNEKFYLRFNAVKTIHKAITLLVELQEFTK